MPLPVAVSDSSVALLPASIPSSAGRAPHSPAPASPLHSYSAPSLGSGAPVSPLGPGAAGSTMPAHIMLSPGGVAPHGSSQG